MVDNAITPYLLGLRAGDSEAIRRVWERFFPPLVERARRKIKGLPAWADDEGVALSAFNSFYRAVKEGRFPQLEDHNDLWRVLLVILHQKVADLRRYAGRRGRGGDRGHVPADDRVPDAAPTSEEEVQMADYFGFLLDELIPAGRRLQDVALMKLAGHTDKEIADQLTIGLRTVERKLELIRRVWASRSH